MKASLITLLIYIAFSVTPTQLTARTSVKIPNAIQAQGPISREVIIKEIHAIDQNLTFTKGKDINHLPHFFANEEGKFSVAIISTEQSAYLVKFIIVMDNNKNQKKYLQIIESISKLLSGPPAKTWVHKNNANLVTSPTQDLNSTFPDGTYAGKLDYLSKNKVLTVAFKGK